MKRLIPQKLKISVSDKTLYELVPNTKNSPEEYDNIFAERQKKEPDWSDVRRWSQLFKKYKEGKILDIGCLDSRIVELIKNKEDYYGIDLAEKAMMSMHNKFPAAHFLVRDLYLTGFDSWFFDYVILGEVLEHLENPREAIEEAFRVLRPGGVLAVSVPLLEEKEPGAVDGDRHIWSFSTEDVQNLVEPYADGVTIKILRSKWFPHYKYCWPQIVCWAIKK